MGNRYCRGSLLRRYLLMSASFLLSGCLHQHYACAPPCGVGALTSVNSAAKPDGASQVKSEDPVPRLISTGLQTPVSRPGTKHRISEYLVRKMRKKQLAHYQVEDLKYASSGGNGQPGNRVSLRFYRGDIDEPAPLVVILPIWGTFDYPSEKLALRLRDHYRGRVHIAVLRGSRRLVQWSGITASGSRDELLRQAQISATHVDVTAEDIRALFRWARIQPEIDSDRLLLAGFSIGAIVGSVAAIREEPGLLGAVLVLGAGSPAEVMAYCNRIASQSRDTAMERLALTHDEYLAIMHQAFDGLDWVAQGIRSAEPARYLVIDAVDDDCMPEFARDALWEGLGRPERYTLKGSHHGAFISMTGVGLNYSNRKILEFIDRRILGAE